MEYKCYNKNTMEIKSYATPVALRLFLKENSNWIYYKN